MKMLPNPKQFMVGDVDIVADYLATGNYCVGTAVYNRSGFFYSRANNHVWYEFDLGGGKFVAVIPITIERIREEIREWQFHFDLANDTPLSSEQAKALISMKARKITIGPELEKALKLYNHRPMVRNIRKQYVKHIKAFSKIDLTTAI